MIDADKYAKVFRAAAEGYMAPYMPIRGGGYITYDGRSYDAARSMAGAFNAIADVFEKLAKGE